MLDVQNLIKQFNVRGAASVHAVDDVSFTVEQGEFFTLLGPSGCGKTTTLRCVAGLERPQSGKIHLARQTVFDAASESSSFRISETSAWFFNPTRSGRILPCSTTSPFL